MKVLPAWQLHLHTTRHLTVADASLTLEELATTTEKKISALQTIDHYVVATKLEYSKAEIGNQFFYRRKVADVVSEGNESIECTFYVRWFNQSFVGKVSEYHSA